MSHHNWMGRILNWRYCVKCGLIALNNAVSRRAANRVCPGGED